MLFLCFGCYSSLCQLHSFVCLDVLQRLLGQGSRGPNRGLSARASLFGLTRAVQTGKRLRQQQRDFTLKDDKRLR